MVLVKIPDVHDFDVQLQNTIFGDRGLMRRQFIGFGALEAAARVARRLVSLTLCEKDVEMARSRTHRMSWPSVGTHMLERRSSRRITV